MTWRVAKSLDVLLGQINAAFPGRSKDSDGSIGDAAHASRSSDHNPWVTVGGVGIVTARDFTHDPPRFDSYAFAEHLRIVGQDSRIKYIISNRKICSGTGQDHAAWVWRPYTGSNPHDHHVHISVKSDQASFDSSVPWNIGMVATQPMPGTKPRTGRPTIKRGSSGEDVAYLQRMLGLPSAGQFDQRTELAVIDFQRKYGLADDGIVGPVTWGMIEK